MTTENIKKLLDTLSMFIAILFVMVGGFLIYSYIQSVLTVINQSDQSVIFWYLPIMFTGVALFGTGLYFGFIFFKSLKGNNKAANLVKTSFKYLSVILLVPLGVILLGNILY